MILVAPSAGGLRPKTMDLLQARYVRFSQLPVVGSVIDVTAGDVIKRVSAYVRCRARVRPRTGGQHLRAGGCCRCR